MNPEDWLKLLPLGVPILTGLLALLGSWVGTKLGKTTEHSQWLRNEKVKIYTDLLRQAHAADAARRQYQMTRQPVELKPEGIEDLTNARMLLIAPPPVQTAVNEHLSTLNTAAANLDQDFDRGLNASYARLLSALQKDMGVDLNRKIPLRQRWYAIQYFFTDPFAKYYYKKHGYPFSQRKNHRRS